MNRKAHRNSFCVVLASLLLLRGVAHGQEPPSRPARIGDLELVAALNGDQPAGIAVSDTGRLFVTFPRHDGDVAFTLGEMKDGRPSAYPSAELNQAVVERPADASSRCFRTFVGA